jgi:hypothetical protein
LITLDNADNFDRKAIFELRENPKQTRLEKGNKGEIEIEYNLILNK